MKERTLRRRLTSSINFPREKTNNSAVKTSTTVGSKWRVREKKALIAAIKEHGFLNLDKLVEAVKTRTAAEIVKLMDDTSKSIRLDVMAESNAPPVKTLLTQTFWGNTPKEVACLEPPYQWLRVLMLCQNETMLRYNHTEILITMFRKIYEDYPEPLDDDPNMPNFKAIYRYLYHIIAGNIPTHPASFDIFVLLSLHVELLKFIKSDIEDETKFVQEFYNNIKFVSEKDSDYSEDESSSSGSIPTKKQKLDSEQTNVPPEIELAIPDHLYQLYRNHLAVIKSLNPMSVPAWLLMKRSQLLNQ